MLMPPQEPSFEKSLTDNLELGTKVKVLPKGIHMWSMKAVSLTIQKEWPVQKFLADKEDRHINPLPDDKF